MNKRIQKISNDALAWVMTQDLTDCDSHDLFVQKFTELIITESVDYINYRTGDWEARLLWVFDDGAVHMNVDLNFLLNQHFGFRTDFKLDE